MGKTLVRALVSIIAVIVAALLWAGLMALVFGNAGVVTQMMSMLGGGIIGAVGVTLGVIWIEEG